MFRRRVLLRAAQVLITPVLIATLAACSGADGPSQVPTSAGNGSTSGGSTSGGSTSSSGSTAGGSDVCTSIPQADVQALLAFPITNTADNSTYYACGYQFSGGTTSFSLTWDPGDAGLDSYNTLKGNADHPVSGIGDMAYWNEAVADHTSPDLEAHKGNATCTIQSNDPPDVTMKTTPATGIYQFTVTDADALAYVQLMGKVCNDIFGAL
jgi:hypothetical protein